MKCFAFAVALLSTAVLEQTLQVNELKQQHNETRRALKAEFEQNLGYAFENRRIDQLAEAHYLLDMLERGVHTMSEREQSELYAGLKQETSDTDRIAILVLLQRGVEIMQASRERIP